MMDVPIRYSWSELIKLAANRDGWRKRVRALTHPIVEVTMNPNVEGSKIRKRVLPPAPPKPKKEVTVMSKYRSRDSHEEFFRPTLSNHKYRTRSRAKKPKPKVLTDKERRAWAREHYEKHHGKPDDPTTTSPATTTATSPSSDPTTTPPPANTTASTKTPISPWTPPLILGHHHHSCVDSASINTTILPPVQLQAMFQYTCNLNTDHENLQNLSNFDI